MTLVVIAAMAVLSQAKQTQVLEPFGYADVQVTGGPMAAQARYARTYYLNLNEDSLLQGFRLRAGLPAPGKPMGGWYDPEGFAAAHPFGQFISALSRMYANSGDRRYRDKVWRLVHGFHQAMAPDGFFYASRKVAREWPCYVYDKMCIAMRDAYTLTGDPEAPIVLAKMTDWAFTHLPRRSDEWYTLPENLYKCFELTHDRRYLTMAAEYDYSKDYYDVFAGGGNAFSTTRHAYSHVNSLSSAAKAYEFGGNAKYLRATENAWQFLTTNQMYASGGWGPDERFVSVGDDGLGRSLTRTPKDFETPCGSYANVNLDRYLLRFTGDPKYGDNMERVLLNGMLAALPPQPDGKSFYYSDYQDGAKKVYFPDVWPCCNGTYAEITADYPLDIYFHHGSRLFVNLFADSAVRWKVGSTPVTIVQHTGFPLESSTRLVVKTKRAVRFTLDVRSPSWCAAPPIVTINGIPVRSLRRSGGRVSIERQWKAGDAVTVSFPRSLRFEAIDSRAPHECALMDGPLLLVALADGAVNLEGDPSRPATWIHRESAGSCDFLTAAGVRFRPLYLVKEERYTTYCHVR